MNNWFKKASYALALPLALMSGSAFAQSRVIVSDSTDIFSGPGYQYPQVGRASFGSSVTLYGCLQDYAWCDISNGYDRGWVDADDLSVAQSGRSYTLYDSRAWFTYPIVGFVFGSYWDNYYRNRPWYGDRYRYQDWRWQNNARPWHGPRPGYRPPPPHYGPRPPNNNWDHRPTPRPPHFNGNRPPENWGNRPGQPGSRPDRPDFNRPGHRPGNDGRPPVGPQNPQRPPMTGGGMRPGNPAVNPGSPPGQGNRPPPSHHRPNQGDRPREQQR